MASPLSPPSVHAAPSKEQGVQSEAAEPSFDTMSVSNSSDDGASATRRPMKNVSRERMKAETTFLRARVQELERELSQTLAKKALARCTTPSPVWRDLAKRQAARREKSEQERDRLRARLLHQLQVAKSLETIFRNRSGAFIDDLCASAAANGHKAYPVDNLALLHDQFMDEIDQVYPLVDRIFTEPVAPQDAMESPLRRSTVVSQPQTNGDDEKLYVELRNAVYVPFTFERVCSAVWRAITTEYSRQQRLLEQHRCTDDEFSCKFFSQSDSLATVYDTMVAIVMRKFTEENRMVLVWRSVDWDRTPGVQRDYGDDTGWLIVTPIIDPDTGLPSSEGAIVQMCDRYVPIWEVQAKLRHDGALQREHADRRGESLQVGEFTNRILNCTEEDIAAITESIENILLDESLGSTDDDLANMIGELDTLRDHHHEQVPDTSSHSVLLDFHEL